MAAAKDNSSKPFAAEGVELDAEFWTRYCSNRPHPTDAFMKQILDYHTEHGHDNWKVAYDIGAGPGNIGVLLAPHFQKIVASDINANALDAGKTMYSDLYPERLQFVHAPAEDLADMKDLPAGAGHGEVDLIIVPECMPLMDQEKSMHSFYKLLRPHGTLAIYFYGRPIFTGDRADECNAIYEKLATRIRSFFHPMKGTSTETSWRFSAEGFKSWLDNVSVPASKWSSVERHKWNVDRPMLFHHESGYDFEVEYIDRREAGELSKEIVDREFWAEDWDLDRIKEFLVSVYPEWEERAGEKIKEVEPLFEQLQTAMGGEGAKKKITFPVCLILASKR